MYKFSTPQALALKRELENRGVIIESEKYDGYKHIDLVIHRAKLNIEVDGTQHWTSADQILRDLERSHYSDEKGYRTIHIPNVLIQSELLPKIADALTKAAHIRAHRRGQRFPYDHYTKRHPLTTSNS